MCCGEWHLFPDDAETGLSAKYLCCCGQCRATNGARVVYLLMLGMGGMCTLASAAVTVGGPGNTAEQQGEARAAAAVCLLALLAITAFGIVGLYGLTKDEPKYVLATFYFFVAAACLAAGLVLACALFFALGGSAFAARVMTGHGGRSDRDEMEAKVESTALMLTLIVGINVLVFLMLDVWFAMITRAAYQYMKAHRPGPRAQPPNATVEPPTATAPSGYSPVPQTAAEATAPPPIQYEEEPPAYDDVVPNVNA